MYGGRYPIDFPTLGPGFGDTGYQNNTFCMSWGSNTANQQVYHCDNMATLVFDGEKWDCWYYKLDGQFYDLQTNSSNPPLRRAILGELVQAINNHPELNAKLKKWRSDALKRLEVSVPRLKEEYENAVKRQKSLQNADFSSY